MNTLTAAIAAKYFGCKVQFNGSERIYSAEMRGLDSQYMYMQENGGTTYMNRYRDCQLILSELADITDEDAIEVAKMNKYVNGKDDAEFIFVGKYSKRIFTDKHPNMCLPFECADFLRSKSYDCDNLITQGIAVNSKNVGI